MNSRKRSKLYLLFIVLISVACSKVEDNEPLVSSVTVLNENKFVRKASLINQDIPFRVVTEDGEDVTSITTFYVNGEPIFGSTFSSDTTGDFEVYGVYIQNGFEVTTETESFSVIIPKRKIVIEDYTGTWCGFCPRVAGAIHSLSEATDFITVVAIHETNNNYPEPMHFDQVQLLKDAFGIEGFPAAKINRSENWDMPHANSDVTSIAGLDTNLALAIDSELIGDALTVQVNVVYEEGSMEGDKLVVYLLEDGIVSDQVNYYNGDSTSSYYNAGNPIEDFVHNETLRNSMSSVLGDAIPATAALTEYTASFTLTVPSNYVTENLSIAAMVVDSNNTAKNSQHAHINEDKPYE
ncbi:Omp28-related outer membrane protein [Winogradskyella vidalii]|uniref:Omp28-related outer membrane protein n=1 Tax=Winogradskyella vidalii TaxID=2615024 RepID=UPI0015C84757|nr:Omp28-related outer membrane protein [Winogradskyella vidalii]